MFRENLLRHIFIVAAALVLSSCQLLKKNDKNPQIRIVDLQGNSRQVITRYPTLNVPALNAQGKAYEKTSKGAFVNSVKSYSSPTYVKKDEETVIANETKIQESDLTPSEYESRAAQENVANSVSAGKVDQIVEYDLGEEQPVAKIVKPEGEVKKAEVVKPAAAKKSSAAKSKKSAVKSNKYYVQVGAYSNRGSAEDVLQKMEKFHAGEIKTVTKGKTLYRVWLGPFTSKSKARSTVAKITKSGGKAILVKDK